MEDFLLFFVKGFFLGEGFFYLDDVVVFFVEGMEVFYDDIDDGVFGGGSGGGGVEVGGGDCYYG